MTMELFSAVTGSIFSHQMSNIPYHDSHSGENMAWKVNSHYFLSLSHDHSLLYIHYP